MRRSAGSAIDRLAPMALGAVCCLATAAQANADGAAERLIEAEHVTTRILSIAGDVAFGEYLAGECVTCHRLSGAADGIPPIVGLPIDYFARSLVEYRLGIRANEVMRLRTARLTDDEIAALVAYFSQIDAR